MIMPSWGLGRLGTGTSCISLRTADQSAAMRMSANKRHWRAPGTEFQRGEPSSHSLKMKAAAGAVLNRDGQWRHGMPSLLNVG